MARSEEAHLHGVTNTPLVNPHICDYSSMCEVVTSGGEAMSKPGFESGNIKLDLETIAETLKKQGELLGHQCYAPIFEAHGGIYCFFYVIAALGAMFVFAARASFSSDPKVKAEYRCKTAQLGYRINHCQDGNENPNIPLLL